MQKQKLHYIGIPFAFKYDFYENSVLKTYVIAGGAIEKCVSAKITERIYSGPQHSLPQTTKLDVEGVQFSVNSGVGLQIKLDRTVGLYFEPGMSYYFDAGNQPPSYRTENPLNFSIRAGVRLSLR